MFGMGMPEILLILGIALIIIGPKKLPDLAKSLGRAMGEFKKATTDLKESMQIDNELTDVKNAFDQMNSDVDKNEKPSIGKDKVAADIKTEEVKADDDTDGADQHKDDSSMSPYDVEDTDDKAPLMSQDDESAEKTNASLTTPAENDTAKDDNLTSDLKPADYLDVSTPEEKNKDI